MWTLDINGIKEVLFSSSVIKTVVSGWLFFKEPLSLKKYIKLQEDEMITRLLQM